MAVVTLASFVFVRSGRDFNEVNRRAKTAFLALMALGTVYLGFATIIGQDLTTALATLMFLLSGGAALGAGWMHRSAVVSSAILFAVGALLLLRPTWRPVVMPIGLAAAFGAVVYASRRAAEDARGAASDEAASQRPSS
jgi:hypothetical protein